VSLMNRATAQQHSDQSEEEGLEPTKEWIKDLIDDVVADELLSPDLELAWVEEDDIDPTKQSAIITEKVKAGRMTLNESRDRDGLERYSDAAADKPMVFTVNGYVPIEANIGVAPGDRGAAPLRDEPEETSAAATETVVG